MSAIRNQRVYIRDPSSLLVCSQSGTYRPITILQEGQSGAKITANEFTLSAAAAHEGSAARRGKRGKMAAPATLTLHISMQTRCHHRRRDVLLLVHYYHFWPPVTG